MDRAVGVCHKHAWCCGAVTHLALSGWDFGVDVYARVVHSDSKMGRNTDWAVHVLGVDVQRQ